MEFEALLAVAGIISPRVTEEDFKRSFELPEKLAKRLRRWIASPEKLPFDLPFSNEDGEQKYEAEKLWHRLGSTRDLSDQNAVLGDDFDMVEFLSRVDAAKALLVKRYPIRCGKDFLDDQIFPPSEDEQQDWLAQVAVIEDPRRLLDELAMETLTPEQVEVFAEVYPELFQFLKEEANLAIAELGAKKSELPDGVEVALQVFLQTGQAPGAPTPPAEEPKPAPDGQTNLKAKDMRSTTERIASK